MSATIRTARSRSSGGYLLDEPPDMTPSFPRTGVSGHAGAVHERGRKEPSSELLSAICTALQLPLSVVLIDAGERMARQERLARATPAGRATGATIDASTKVVIAPVVSLAVA
ncbi:hypothetical protein [Mycobacterium tuberculosis]|uniref:hypothetical protein n=1 Tax=Mycobacterium tuberculosis TaxID=1773 RepID=UPI000994DC2F